MRILKLNIKNLASIESAEIDFTASPLVDNPLFLICGATGSGKTTILDAITIALYNKTSRFSESNKSERVDEGDYDEQVQANNTIRLVRRGTNNASVELTFESIEGLEYKVVWEAKRSPRLGKFKEPKWRVTYKKEGNEVTLLGKKEVANEIERAAGLDFQQFTRTTLLAQGKFTEFLKSKDDDKSAILEKILGNDIYSRVGVAVQATYKEKSDVVSLIETKFGCVNLLSDEEERLLGEEIRAIEQDTIRLGKELSQEESKLKWLEKLKEIEERIEKGKKEVEEANVVLASEEMVAKKEVLKLWDRSVDLRNAIKTNDEKKSEYEKIASENKEYKDKYVGACNSLKYKDEVFKEIEGELNKVDKKLNELQPYSSMLVDDYDMLQENVRAIVANDSDIEKCKNEIGSLSKEIEGQKDKMESAQKELQELKRNCDEKRKEFDIINERVQEEDGEKLAEKLTNIGSAKTEIEHLGMMLRDWETKKSSHEEAEKNKILAEKALQEKEGIKEETIKEKKEAEAEYAEVSSKVDIARQLISKLKEGEKCPVCGGVFNGAGDHEDGFDRLLKEKEAVKNEKEGKASAASDAYNTAKVCKENAVNQLQSAEKQEKQAHEAYDKKLLDARKAVAKCGRELPMLVTADAIDILFSEVEEAMKDLKSQNEELEKLRKEADKLRKEWDQARDSHDGKLSVLSKLQREYAANETKMNGETDRKNSLEKANEEKWATLQKKLTYKDGVERDKVSEIGERLKRDYKLLADNESKKKELSSKSGDLAKEIEEARKQKEEMLAMVQNGNWAEVTVTAVATEGNIVAEWSELLGNFKKWRKTLESARCAATEAEGKLKTLVADFDETNVRNLMKNYNDNTIQSIREEVNNADKNKEKREASLQEATEEKGKLEANRPLISENETIETLTVKRENLQNQIDSKNKEMGGLQQKKQENEVQKAKGEEIKGELEKAKKEKELWERLNEFMGDTKGNKFRGMALRLLMKELLHYANEHLRKLTGARFTLECYGDSLGIAIRDAFSCNSLQMPANLSGGESFVVSLALALGLSTMAGGNKAASDILFIDEGFGTLDENYLSNVVEVLERLNESGKRVGIISHVEELKEKIRTQIIVERTSLSSRVKIVG